MDGKAIEEEENKYKQEQEEEEEDYIGLHRNIRYQETFGSISKVYTELHTTTSKQHVDQDGIKLGSPSPSPSFCLGMCWLETIRSYLTTLGLHIVENKNMDIYINTLKQRKILLYLTTKTNGVFLGK